MDSQGIPNARYPLRREGKLWFVGCLGRRTESHSYVACCLAGLMFTDEILSPSKKLMASSGDGEVHGMEDIGAEDRED